MGWPTIPFMHVLLLRTWPLSVWRLSGSTSWMHQLLPETTSPSSASYNPGLWVCHISVSWSDIPRNGTADVMTRCHSRILAFGFSWVIQWTNHAYFLNRATRILPSFTQMAYTTSQSTSVGANTVWATADNYSRVNGFPWPFTNPRCAPHFVCWSSSTLSLWQASSQHRNFTKLWSTWRTIWSWVSQRYVVLSTVLLI